MPLLISQIGATDGDSVGGMVRYRLTNASPFSALSQFSINRTNGQLSLLQSLDRETDPTLTLVVTASDMGEPGEQETTPYSRVTQPDSKFRVLNFL